MLPILICSLMVELTGARQSIACPLERVGSYGSILGALDQTQDEDKDDRANGRNDDTSEQTATSGHAQ